MEIAMLGLGRMGGNMARRLLRGGHPVVVWNREPRVAEHLQAEEGRGVAAHSLGDLAYQLNPPRCAWMMVPAGAATEELLGNLLAVLGPGDLVVDGGNANYHDTQRRAALVEARGLSYVDAGVSGGVWGLSAGYGLMVGGRPEAVARLRPVLETLAPAPDQGWAHLGPSGAGHYAKMIHNGVEYGMMQALAEGFDLLRARQEFGFDLAQVAEAWRHGTVIRSWLLDLAAAALHDDPSLERLAAHVDDSGEGRWTVMEALALDVPAPVITQALYHRFYSRGNGLFASRLLAALRQQFGGHSVVAAPPLEPPAA